MNLAYLLTTRAARGSGHDAIADAVTARRVREKVTVICDALLASGKISGDEAYWLAASGEEAWFGLGNPEKTKEWADRAGALAKEGWMRDSSKEQLEKLAALLKRAEETIGTAAEPRP